MNNARIASRYTNLLKNIYKEATITVKAQEDVTTNRIPINRGIRQGNRISPKLFTVALEDVFRRLDWDKKGLRVDGRYLSNLRFADDTVLISSTKEELIEMLADLKRESV